MNIHPMNQRHGVDWSSRSGVSLSAKSTVVRQICPAHRAFGWVAGAVAIVLGLAGCSSPNLTPVSPDDAKPYRSVSLREGDAVQIVFPGAPSLNTVQQVRRDGMITLDEGNELIAAGKSPVQLQDEILALYSARLVRKEVLVTVGSSAYPVFVSGAVLRPGKIMVTEPLTVVEAIMEAGGMDENRAQSKKVMVTRDEDGVVSHYRLNVKDMLRGHSKTRFYLRPMDVVYVPTKIQVW